MIEIDRFAGVRPGLDRFGNKIPGFLQGAAAPSGAKPRKARARSAEAGRAYQVISSAEFKGRELLAARLLDSELPAVEIISALKISGQADHAQSAAAIQDGWDRAHDAIEARRGSAAADDTPDPHGWDKIHAEIEARRGSDTEVAPC